MLWPNTYIKRGYPKSTSYLKEIVKKKTTTLEGAQYIHNMTRESMTLAVIPTPNLTPYQGLNKSTSQRTPKKDHESNICHPLYQE